MMVDRIVFFVVCIVAVLAIVLGVGIRLLVVIQQHEFVWIDELHTAWTVSGDWGDVAQRARAGNQSPLYFWVEYLWIGATDFDSVQLREPSLIAGVLLISAIGLFLWRLTGDVAMGLLGAAIAAVEPHSIFYATEARPYAWVQVVAVCQCFLFLRWLHRDASRTIRVLFLIASVMLFYLHFTSVVFLVMQSLVAVIIVEYKKIPRKRAISMALEFGAVALACLPGLLTLAAIGVNRQQWNSFGVFSEYFQQVRGIWIVAFLVPATLLTICWLVSRMRENMRLSAIYEINENLLIIGGIFVSTILFVAIVCLPIVGGRPLAPLGNVRYVISAVAIAPMLIGLFTGGLKHRGVRCAVAAGMLLLSVSFSPVVYQTVATRKVSLLRTERWDLVTQEIVVRNKRENWSKPVLLCANLVEDSNLVDDSAIYQSLREYCRFPFRSRLFRLPEQHIIPVPTFANKRLTRSTVERVRKADGFYLVARVSFADFERLRRELVEEFSDQWVRVRFVDVKQFENSDVIFAEVETYQSIVRKSGSYRL